MGSVLQRHPGFHLKNQYNTQASANPFVLFRQANQLRQEIPALLKDLTMPEMLPSVRVEYSYKSNGSYDLATIQELIGKIIEGLTAVSPVLATVKMQSLEATIALLPKEDRIATAFFKVAPFVWGPDGNPLPEFEGKTFQEIRSAVLLSIASKQGDDLENAYNDIFLKHHLELFKYVGGYWQMRANSFANQFIKSALQKALALSQQATAVINRQSVVVVEMPTATTPLRGLWDCSGTFVPFFAMAKGVRTFWIYAGDTYSSDSLAEPIGYALVADGVSGKSAVPYVVTINGGIDSTATRATLLAIGKMYDASSLAVPDLQFNGNVVNSDDIRHGMRGGKQSLIVMPSSWNEIYRLNTIRLGQAASPGSLALYQPERISHARILDLSLKTEVELISAERFESKNPYQPPNWKLIDTFDRVLLASQALGLKNQPLAESIEAIGLSSNESIAANFIARQERESWLNISLKQVVELSHTLGVSTVYLIRKLEVLSADQPLQMGDVTYDFIAAFPDEAQGVLDLAYKYAVSYQRYLEWALAERGSEDFGFDAAKFLQFLPIDPLDEEQGFLFAGINRLKIDNPQSQHALAENKYQLTLHYLQNIEASTLSKTGKSLLDMIQSDPLYDNIKNTTRRRFLEAVAPFVTHEQILAFAATVSGEKKADADMIVLNKLRDTASQFGLRDGNQQDIPNFVQALNRIIDKFSMGEPAPKSIDDGVYNVFHRLRMTAWSEELFQAFDRYWAWRITVNPQSSGIYFTLSSQPNVSPERRQRWINILEAREIVDSGFDYAEERNFLQQQKVKIVARLEALNSLNELSPSEQQEIFQIMNSFESPHLSRHKTIREFNSAVRQAYIEATQRLGAQPSSGVVKSCAAALDGTSSLVPLK